MTRDPSTGKTFGQQLRDCRLRAGLSQEDLADATGLHRTYVSLLERGKREPTFDVIVKLARGLGVTAAELVNWAAPK